MNQAREERNRIIAGKIQAGLLEHFDGDHQKVTDFLQTHHLPHIAEDEETGVVTVRYQPHHDDLEAITITLTPGDEP